MTFKAFLRTRRGPVFTFSVLEHTDVNRLKAVYCLATITATMNSKFYQIMLEMNMKKEIEF